jgi:hypothetical protein
MKVTLKVTKPLQQYIPQTELQLEVSDYFDIVAALKSLFPPFKKLLSSIKSNVSNHQDICLVHNSKVIETRQLATPIRNSNPIYLTPVIFGGAPTYGVESSAYYNSLKSSFMYPLFGLSTASYEQMDVEGMGKRVADSSLFGRAESIYDVEFRENNDLFRELKITNTANAPVGLIYGETRVAGNNINTYIKNYRANPDFFRVSDVVTSSSYGNALALEYVLPGYMLSDYVTR